MYGKSTALQVFSRKRMCWTWKALGKICVQFPSSWNGCVLEVSLPKRIICDQIEFSWINSTGNRKLRNDTFDNLPRLPYGPGTSNLSHALCSSQHMWDCFLVLSNGMSKKTMTGGWWSPCSREVFYRILSITFPHLLFSGVKFAAYSVATISSDWTCLNFFHPFS